MKLERSKRLITFIDELGIDKTKEIYSINHPTENEDRRDFRYNNFRIKVEINEGKYLTYSFTKELFLPSSLNGIHLQSLRKVFLITDHEFNTFSKDLSLFQTEVYKMCKQPALVHIKRTIKRLQKSIMRLV